MTALKLPMPGVRDRAISDEGESAGAVAGGGAGAGAGPLQLQQQQRQSDIGKGYAGGVPAGEQQQQGRCSNSSRVGGDGHTQARLGPAIMQPLPLASRHAAGAAGAGKHAPASALESSWIRRFLPSTGELGQETTTTRPPTKAVLGGRGGDSGFQPPGPLLLASAPNEHTEQQQGARGMASKGRLGPESARETSVRIPVNGESMQKGKAPLENESRQQETTPGALDGGENVVRISSFRKVSTVPSLNPGTQSFAVEGNSTQQHTQQQQQQQELQGNHKRASSPRGESHKNGTSGAVVTGFGPLRVVVKAPTKGAGGSVPKSTGIEVETRTEKEVPAAAAGDRDKHIGIHTISSQPGTMFNPLSKSRLVEDPWSGRPSRAVEFASAWGFPRSKKQEMESDGGRPSTVRQDGARETAVGVSGLKGVEPSARFNPFGESSYRPEAGHHKGVDHGSGVEKAKLGSSSKFSERFVSSGLPANLGKKEEIGQGTDSRLHSRAAAEDASTWPQTGAGFSAGGESRKMKEVMGSGLLSRRHSDLGPAEQRQCEDVRPYASHQFEGEMCIGKVGHPLPFSPHSSYPGEENNSGEDTRNSKGRADRPNSPLPTPFGASKAYEDGLDDRAARSEQHTPWTSLFAAFNGQRQPEPDNSSSQIPPVAPVERSTLQDGSIPANRPVEVPQVNGDREDPSGANDARPSASLEARSRFDNQSSHFSNSPWPEEDNPIPNDDGGSGPYNSQATGSGYQSQASRVANRSEGESKGKYTSAYRGDNVGAREGFGIPGRSRESSASEPELNKFVRNHGQDQVQKMSNQYEQARFSTTPLDPFTRQTMSGYKDDTSGSSPPSYPQGYNSSDMCSPALPRGIVDEHLLSVAGKSRKVEVDFDTDGIRVPRMHKGHRKETVGLESMRPMEHMNSLKRDKDAVYRDHKDTTAFLSKNPDLNKSQPTMRDFEPGVRYGKLRMSGDAMGDGGVSGPAKRTRHYPNLGGGNVGSQMAGSAVPSSWLKRWLPPSSGNAAKPPAGFARPKENPRSGTGAEQARSNGNSNFKGFSNDRRTEAQGTETGRGKSIDTGAASMSRNGMKDIATTRGLNGLTCHPPPSAAAMALVGTAARKMGTFPPPRKGSVAMWPQVHLQNAQGAEAQRAQSSELSL